MSIGRNDPCPCGSGKKYKKCHGALTSAATRSDATRANTLKALDVKLGDRVMRFARLRYGPEWLIDALDSHGLLDDGEPTDSEMPLVIPWLLYLMRDPTSGLTIAEEWRGQERQISDDERLLIDAYDAAWVSMWEVEHVEPGVGTRLTDVLTRQERFVHDVRSSSTLERFDTLLAIIVSCDEVSFFGGVHGQPLPPRFAEMATREARRMCHVRTRAVQPGILRHPDMQLELMALWSGVVQNMLDQPPPVLQNTDGDLFLLTRDDFALLAPREQVMDRLASLEGVGEAEHDGDDTFFVVTRAGNAVHRSWDNTVIGRIVVSANRLIVETNSTRRADSLRAALLAHLHGSVRFRLRKEESTAPLMTSPYGSTGTKRVREPMPPEAVAAMRAFREQHMAGWLDESIPALGGLTPRDAARSPRTRPKLEVLLKEFQRREARLPPDERIDLGWLREALGFSRTTG